MKVSFLIPYIILSLTANRICAGHWKLPLSERNYGLIFSVGIIILLSLISLTYSSNKVYGFYKWLNLTLITAPFILLSINNFRLVKTKAPNISPGTAALFLSVLSVLIIILNPFDYSGIPYKLDFARWSHVVTGRTLAFLFLVILLCALFQKKR